MKFTKQSRSTALVVSLILVGVSTQFVGCSNSEVGTLPGTDSVDREAVPTSPKGKAKPEADPHASVETKESR